MSLDSGVAAERLLEVLEQEIEEETADEGVIPEMLVVKAWLYHVLDDEQQVIDLIKEYAFAARKRLLEANLP